MGSISICGIECTKCKEYQKSCKGCAECGGAVTWTRYYGIKVCAIYQCAILDKKLNSCGDCDQMPCDKWYATKDPSYTKEEFQQNIEERVKRIERT